MWLFTSFGFFSVVQKDGETGLTVRSRFDGDLEQLRQKYLPTLSPTVVTPDADYRFRASVSHAALAAAMAKIVGDIGYDNFKDCVAKEQGWPRHDVYADVWEVMWKAQKRQ